MGLTSVRLPITDTVAVIMFAVEAAELSLEKQAEYLKYCGDVVFADEKADPDYELLLDHLRYIVVQLCVNQCIQLCDDDHLWVWGL